MGQRTVDDLIELIYEAALFPEKWQDAARSIAESVGGEASSVCWIDKKLGAVTRFDISNFDDSILPEYAERFGHRDPRVLKGIVSPDGTVYRDHEIIPEYGRIYAEYYSFIEKIGVFHSMILIAENNPATTVGFNIYRRRQKGAFEDTEKQQIEILSRHIRKAVALSRQMEKSELRPGLGQETFLSLIGLPAFLLDCRGLVTSHNDAAAVLIQKADPLILRSATLMALTAAQQSALEALVGLALRSRTADTIVLSDRSGAQYLAEAIPMAQPGSGASKSWRLDEPCILLTLRPLEPQVRADQLVRIMGFTAAEAEVAALLAAGHDIDTIAQMRGVSAGTTRVQVKSAFAKANVSSQAQLVSRVLSMAGVLRLSGR